MGLVTTVVTYDLPPGTDRETAIEMFRASVPRYQSTPGLLRKNVLYDEGIGGGVYLWESRAAAEAAYDDAWVAYMTEKYEHTPRIVYYETPIVIDNEYRAVTDKDAA